MLAHSCARYRAQPDGAAEIIMHADLRAPAARARAAGSVTSRKSFSIPVTADPKSVPRSVLLAGSQRRSVPKGPKREAGPQDRATSHTRARSSEVYERGVRRTRFHSRGTGGTATVIAV